MLSFLAPISMFNTDVKINFNKLLKNCFTFFLALIAFTIIFERYNGFSKALALPIINGSIADSVEKVTPAVVNISTTQKIDLKNRFSNVLPDELGDLLRDLPFLFHYAPPGVEKDNQQPNQPQKSTRKITSLGSGFIVDKSGYIVTNNHVIDGADEISITLSTGTRSYKAKVIGSDPKTDIALLKIETKSELPYLEFANSDVTRVGDLAIAIGNPFGLGGTVTAGVVSAKARYISSNTLDDFIQTDAAINQGSSGGPLCNISGEVIGVNSVIMSTSPTGGSVGIGFAIPSNIVQPIIKQLREKGKIERGWLGVKVQNMDQDIANGLGLSESKGALVTNIVKGSPADKAGIKVGDVIVKFDDKEIVAMNMLPRIVGETVINKKVSIDVLRDNKTVQLSVIIEKPANDNPFESSSVDSKSLPVNEKILLGLTVQNLSPELKLKYSITEEKGVVVIAIDENSISSLAGIMQGDVIISVNQKQINNIEEFEKEVEKMKKAGKETIVLLLSRRGETLFIGMSIT